jgi:hypothetical protein
LFRGGGFNKFSWGQRTESDKIFKIQKRAIRIITNSRMRDSCRELFRKLEILPLYSQYILSIAIFVIKKTNVNFIRIIRSTTNLHPPTAQLKKKQKGVYYSEIKVFNSLPHDINELANEVIPFRNILRTFLLIHSFYNIDEYFNYKRHYIGH